MSRRAVVWFVVFYYISTLVYYTATWIYYGAFQKGHPPYFEFEEFFSAAGFRFAYSFLCTIPIWFIVMRVIYPIRPLLGYLSHLVFLPLFTLSVYHLLAVTKDFFGWMFIWDSRSTVWTMYLIATFYVLQFLLIHGYQYYIAHKQAVKQQAELEKLALKSQVTALKAQLNPHFLHNLFNSINATLPKENEATREMIIALSNLFRYQNLASQKDLVSIQEELEFIKNYLSLVKIRFKDRLQYSIKVPDELMQKQIPPMILQPLVENAINHGISPKLGVGRLSIAIEKAGDRLHFQIGDTGVGMPADTDFWNKGLGLKNTRERLRKLYHTELEVQPNHPEGTLISFNL